VLVAADDDVEQVADGDGGEGELEVRRRFADTMPSFRPCSFSATSTSSMPTHTRSSSWSGSLCSR
jgi:hypothetical protein